MGARKRPCRICKADLNAWGDRKGICPTCAEGLRSSLIMCAGRCKKKHPLRMMEGVNIYFDAGQKGGKKYKLHYCSVCALSAKSRARSVEEGQGEEIQSAERRMGRSAQVVSKRRV